MPHWMVCRRSIVTYSPGSGRARGAPCRSRSSRAWPPNAASERLVLLSGRGEEEAQRCERIVLRTQTPPGPSSGRAGSIRTSARGSSWIRCATVCSALPAGDVREPFIDADDIADVAVAALTEAGHEGQIYEVTGPRLMTFAEAVEDIARATGREPSATNRFQSKIMFDGMLAAAGSRGARLADAVSVRDGAGRPQRLHNRRRHSGPWGARPRDFADFAREAAATGVWAVSGPGEDRPAADNGSAKGRERTGDAPVCRRVHQPGRHLGTPRARSTPTTSIAAPGRSSAARTGWRHSSPATDRRSRTSRCRSTIWW